MDEGSERRGDNAEKKEGEKRGEKKRGEHKKMAFAYSISVLCPILHFPALILSFLLHTGFAGLAITFIDAEKSSNSNDQPNALGDLLAFVGAVTIVGYIFAGGEKEERIV